MQGGHHRTVTRYLEAYVEIAPRLGAEWIVMHAGFHFTSDKERRMAAGLERLKRIVSHAERHGALVLLENLNKEPEQAEVHYLAHTVEEWRYYFDAIQSPAFKLSFTVNHAHLVPEGIAGFVNSIDMSRVEEVRLADCFRNGHEVHLKPGAGDIDFADMFRRIEGNGFTGHYMNAFGSLDDMLAGRDEFVGLAGSAVAVNSGQPGGKGLFRLRPTLAQPQYASAGGTTFAVPRPGSALGLRSIAGQPCAECRDQHRAHAVRTAGNCIGLGVDQERLT